jgi:hypothetical protein
MKLASTEIEKLKKAIKQDMIDFGCLVLFDHMQPGGEGVDNLYEPGDFEDHVIKLYELYLNEKLY